MYWLIQTHSNHLQIWTEREYQIRVMKCEYYGAKPFWQMARRLKLSKLKFPIFSDIRTGEIKSQSGF